MEKKKKIILLVGILAVAGIGIYLATRKKEEKASVGASPAAGGAVAPPSEVEAFMKDIATWDPEWKVKVRAFMSKLNKADWDDFWPIWHNYYYAGKINEAPPALADKFQVVVNKAQSAGAWPG